MNEPTPRKLSLNQLPDADRMAKIVERAEQNQQARAAAHKGSDPSSDMINDHPAALLPPADWPIERKALHGKVVAALKQVYDPEIPVDIYELGLIYGIAITPANEVKVTMTLTAPGCPVADSLPRDVAARIENITEVKDADVQIVWDPPWSQDRMSEAARMHLGFF